MRRLPQFVRLASVSRLRASVSRLCVCLASACVRLASVSRLRASVSRLSRVCLASACVRLASVRLSRFCLASVVLSRVRRSSVSRPSVGRLVSRASVVCLASVCRSSCLASVCLRLRRSSCLASVVLSRVCLSPCECLRELAHFMRRSSFKEFNAFKASELISLKMFS